MTLIMGSGEPVGGLVRLGRQRTARTTMIVTASSMTECDNAY